MRRLAPCLAAVAASLVLASCGGGGGNGPPAPQGPPAGRHPATDLAANQTAEEMRAHLIAATRLYLNGKYGFATAHLDAAKAEYATLSAAVRTRDAVLDREFHAAFDVIGGKIVRRAPAPDVMNRMGLVQGQLLDAAIQDSVSKPGLNDPGLAALVMMRLADQGARQYALASQEGFTDPGRRAYQEAFGLITRASALSHRISPSLGAERNTVINALNDAHNVGFPTGILVPRKMPASRLAADVQRARAGVSRRFGFTA